MITEHSVVLIEHFASRRRSYVKKKLKRKITQNAVVNSVPT